MLERLTPGARQVLEAASNASDDFGHAYVGNEHVLLGILLADTGSAQRFLREHGLDAGAVSDDLLSLAEHRHFPQMIDDTLALHHVGIDVEQVRAQLANVFGQHALAEAVRRTGRRSRWRGGGRSRTPLCGKPFTAKRALEFAATYAEKLALHDVTPEYLLYGVLQDAAGPFGTSLSRRGRRLFTQSSWSIGASNPVAMILASHGLDLRQLRRDLSADLDIPPL